MEHRATAHRATASLVQARPTPATASRRPVRRPEVQARTEPLPTAGAPGLSPTARPQAGRSPMAHSPTGRARPAPPRTVPPQPAQARAGRPPAGRARTDLQQAAQRRAVLLRAPLRQTTPARQGRTRLLVDRSERPTTQPTSSRRTLLPSTAAVRPSATAAAPSDQLKAGSPAGIVEPAPPITMSPPRPAWSNPAPASPPATSRIPATRPAPTSPAPTAPAQPGNQPQTRPRTAPAPQPLAPPAVPPRHPPRLQRIRPAPQRRPVRGGHAGTGSTTCGR
jgi:hypothetical protein